jgi:hypothetical protein
MTTAKTPNTTGHLFTRKQAVQSLNRGPARDTLAEDMLAFERAGGVIEKLGTTCMFKRIPTTESAHPSPARSPSKARHGPG